MGKSTNTRLANIEAFRVCSMLLVLLVHSLFLASGRPEVADFVSHPIKTSAYSFFEYVSLCGVNCFVLISGYFGIKLRILSLSKLLFTVWFYLILLYIIGLQMGGGETLKEFVISLSPFGGQWFVGVYIALCLSAPFLNAYIDQTDRQKLGATIVIFLIIESIWGWLNPTYEITQWLDFNGGFSLLSFIGLYLIGRYVKLYNAFDSISKVNLLFVFFGVTALNTVIYIILLFNLNLTDSLSQRILIIPMKYSNPFMIVQAVALLLLFSKIHFKSKRISNFIKWLGSGAFAVYLIHTNDLISPLYLETCKHFFTTASILWIFEIFAFIIAVYLICAVIDVFRRYVWNCVIKNVIINKEPQVDIVK